MAKPVDVRREREGDFIVLEGIDGSGTTTQAKQLMDRFERYNIDATFTFQPSELPIGKLIRSMLRHEIVLESWHAEAALFAADRAEHLMSEIEPALKGGRTVVCDRYDLSNYVYQMYSRPNAPVSELLREFWLKQLNEHHRRPDLTIVLDISAGAANRRREERAGPAELFEVPRLQRKFAQRYAIAEQLVPRDYLVHIDAGGSIDAVSDAIWSAYEHYVRLKGIKADARSAGELP